MSATSSGGRGVCACGVSVAKARRTAGREASATTTAGERACQALPRSPARARASSIKTCLSGDFILSRRGRGGVGASGWGGGGFRRVAGWGDGRGGDELID
eukprot:scaffold16918_cov118-Isochrysis_galbana.AAC.1